MGVNKLIISQKGIGAEEKPYEWLAGCLAGRLTKCRGWDLCLCSCGRLQDYWIVVDRWMDGGKGSIKVSGRKTTQPIRITRCEVSLVLFIDLLQAGSPPLIKFISSKAKGSLAADNDWRNAAYVNLLLCPRECGRLSLTLCVFSAIESKI